MYDVRCIVICMERKKTLSERVNGIQCVMITNIQIYAYAYIYLRVYGLFNCHCIPIRFIQYENFIHEILVVVFSSRQCCELCITYFPCVFFRFCLILRAAAMLASFQMGKAKKKLTNRNICVRIAFRNLTNERVLFVVTFILCIFFIVVVVFHLVTVADRITNLFFSYRLF